MFRTAALLALLTAIMLAVGFFLAGTLGMTAALIIAIVVNFISYWYSDRIVLSIYRAHHTNDHELNSMVEKIAREAGIPKPKVYIVPSDLPNAFATGRSPQHAAVAVTQGLSVLSKDEMEAVIAHEISHIKNRDTLVQTVAATIAGAISYLAYFGWNMSSDRRRGTGSIIGLILILIFAPLAAAIVKMAISRRREYGADFGGAILTKHPMALASALRKISNVTRENPMHGSTATSHLWIVNPFRHDFFGSLFSTHPPLERRVAKLERMVVKKGEKND